LLNLDPAVAGLRANWHLLRDFERAQAILPIVRAGMSRRHLAIVLNVSEGTIRNLLLILQADPDDLALFRRGDISQNEILRRVRGHGAVPETHGQQVERSNQPSVRPPKRPNSIEPVPLLPLLSLRRERRVAFQL